MRIEVRSKQEKVTDSLKAHITRKVEKLSRYLDDIREATVELVYEHTRSASDQHVVQLTLAANGAILRAEEAAEDVRSALDLAVDKMQQQLLRFKQRRQDKKRIAWTIAEGEEVAAASPGIVRTKVFDVKPMDRDEAVEQMELLGHDFFVFFDSANDQVAVLYRRDQGGYGLILPRLG